ncbi:helix-turn-helix domain-containing protein [Sphingomonas crusticola]|uniref:helix-turn-helix domain-containing protein n=1 Tax=Sphingomonas crusticola TaxID=1697973 RepID=UPI000E26F50C|nr:helix-turn-helix transcriptional regulator [Sphingomonas crusticola]
MTSPREQDRYPPIGMLLREWRSARRMSQLDMALECGMSARHLGFVETGKANASREAVGRFADALAISLRERNALLLAAGYAPVYEERELTTSELERMRDAVGLILRHQNPYPAFVLNRHFDVLDANESAVRINRFVMQGRESGHRNLLHQIFDPDDFRPAIANWHEVASGFLRRLHDHLAATPGDARGQELLAELSRYPDVPQEWRFRPVNQEIKPVLTLDFHSPAGTLRFFETITTFAAPFDVTLDELRIDCAFPADALTASTCAALAADELPAP